MKPSPSHLGCLAKNIHYTERVNFPEALGTTSGAPLCHSSGEASPLPHPQKARSELHEEKKRERERERQRGLLHTTTTCTLHAAYSVFIVGLQGTHNAATLPFHAESGHFEAMPRQSGRTFFAPDALSSGQF